MASEYENSLVPDALEFLDPATLDYNEWVAVGMALHAERYSCDVWDQWSQRDPARYHPGDCYGKWASFGQYDNAEVGGGTIVKMARDRGLIEPGDSPLGWGDVVSVIDEDSIEPIEVPRPDKLDPVHEVVTYLDALFKRDDIVGFVLNAAWDEDKWVPADRGCYTMTAGQIIDELTSKRSIENVLGTYNEDAGAWIRFNPLDGEGVKNANVADYRYALVESDDIPIEKQRALVEELNLPCAIIVNSGHKSIHAIVKVDAIDYKQYTERVNRLYDICDKNGLKVDRQNKNPSRLSRLPGFKRGDNLQYIVDVNCGLSSWAEWVEWYEGQTDDLPDAESLADVWEDMPDLAPPLIDGVLRQGHKMLLAGPSKAGKSFALIELCVAIAEGGRWLGFDCAQGRVLYVNLELDRASCLHRFKDVFTALGADPVNLKNIDIWNLRGKSKPMDKLAPSLIRRALKTQPIAVVLDPIYKVITGDENSADQMARFCNQFDKVATEVGCAVIYCHHHSKGSQGGKRSMDRASGSGVFARDPDAQLDMIQLPIDDKLRERHADALRLDALEAYADGFLPHWRDRVPEDHRSNADLLVSDLKGLISDCHAHDEHTGGAHADETAMLNASARAYGRAQSETAWRIEATLREFPPFDPLDVWFDYPLHHLDEAGELKKLMPEADQAPWERGAKKNVEGNGKRKTLRWEDFRDALNNANMGDPPTAQEMANYLGCTKKTVENRIKEFGAIKRQDGPNRFVVMMPDSLDGKD